MSSSKHTLLTGIYYRVKPLVPVRVRWMLRRLRARWILEHGAGQTWPINEAAASTPEGWTGWPEGRRFAVVLTHDVESRAGLEKVRQLAELEMELGFRSSFNFIPEGPYRVPDELRSWLVENGFEVGVHDLNHDGRLYASRESFRRKAERINHYLKEWGAVGFRSGFMLRQLDWLHDLEIDYDASTFDSDPFEPQPDGAGNIFPFLVSKESDSYVELPYTLPQDSTLFLLLRERTPDIWLRKLDWLAGKGGMALLNLHPDYVAFDDGEPGTVTFPAAHYRTLLETIRDRHGGPYWQPLPKELARWFRQCVGPDDAPPAREAESQRRTAAPVGPREPAPEPLAGKRVAVLLYSSFPSDPRPRRAALAMAAAGMSVDSFCLRESDEEAERETCNGVNVFRLPMKRKRNSKLTYMRQYASFLVRCFFMMVKHSCHRRYDVVHVHNMPDILVFSALVPKLFGSKIILDLHDPMPELMRCIYELPKDHRMVGALKRLEKWSIRFADLVLTPNEAFRKLFIERGCPPGKIAIVMNSPQASIFDPSLYPAARPVGADPGAFRLMHHGFLASRHGVDLAIRAVDLLRDEIPELRFDIYGGHTPYVDELKTLIEELGLPEDTVRFHGRQLHPVIARAILDCDLGLIPNRRSAFTEINMPTRIFEYVAMGRPVIVPDTRGIRDYFDDESALFFEPDDPEKLAAAILAVYRDPARTIPIGERARRIYEQHRWESERATFLEKIRNLFRPTGGAPQWSPPLACPDPTSPTELPIGSRETVEKTRTAPPPPPI